MNLRFTSWLLLVSWSLASPLLPRDDSPSPCAVVSSIYSAVHATAPRAIPTVDAQLGYECLTSVPLHAPEAIDFVNAIVPFVDFQSNTAYIKNPPKGWTYPAVDLYAQFQAAIANISSGAYRNEHEFQTNLLKIVQSAHDEHFVILPDLLAKAIIFRRTISLVSVSLDGIEPPKIFYKDDILNANTSDFIPSAVSKIDGEIGFKFIEDLMELGSMNDRDAEYNAMFFSPGIYALYAWPGEFAGANLFSIFYPGPNTTIEYENGTTIVYPNVAFVTGNFTGVTDGESFYQKFCKATPTSIITLGPLPTATSTGIIQTNTASITTRTSSISSPSNSSTTIRSSTSIPASTPTAIIPPGYPAPVVISSDQIVGGYYLPNTDIAVLSMLSFSPRNPAEFQMVVQKFLATAKADGKTKLVVDLAANGGGYIFQGYDTFRQLFPHIEQDGYTRFRASEAFLLIAEEVSNLIANNSEYAVNFKKTAFDYTFDENLQGKPFSSPEAKFGPQQFNGDNFTNIIRWNQSEPVLKLLFGIGGEITGYGSRANFTQPFAAEDIIMIYDGFCASTCTLFSEFMRTQAGVKSISFGGRTPPSRITPITQAIGGTKGANNYQVSSLISIATNLFAAGTAEQRASEKWSILKPLMNTLITSRSLALGINVRDNILPDDLDDGVPAQFIYEPADCRLFYTPAMMQNVTAIWEAAAMSAWGGKKCNAGSLPGGTSVMKRGINDIIREIEVIRLSGEQQTEPEKNPWILADARKRMFVQGFD